ncbi:conserved hypothetical protein [delta proteobacterium NaphS2]|nr:conserved hypothetical protein [delta proteobacterium NaphS2]
MPILVNGTAKLISKVIHRVGDAVSSIFMFSAMSGEARLQGFIVICLYLIGILVLFRVFVRMGGKDDDEA